MAITRDLADERYHVVAVIGDGAITGGMALEGLNHAGHLGSRLIIILNHNGMSILPTVGALARILNKVRLDHRYHQAKEGGRQLIKSLPMDDNLWEVGQHLEKALKGLVMPTVIWEELGFTYVGPVDGHNIAEVEEALARARDYPHGPIPVHVITTKGKGYSPAENDAVHFHGLSAKTTNVEAAPTYSDIFARTVLKLSREDPRIVSITPAMPEGSCLNIVKREFPDRVFDVGICEQHAVTFAAGLATQGFRPIVAIYSTFLQRAFDQVIHDVCLQDLPVVFAIYRAGIVGDDGKTH
jgi:1-deoxy-D-xylulose-5-phosphate synthase